jgi:hypothetical protein
MYNVANISLHIRQRSGHKVSRSVPARSAASRPKMKDPFKSPAPGTYTIKKMIFVSTSSKIVLSKFFHSLSRSCEGN